MSLSFLRVWFGLCIFCGSFLLVVGFWGERFYEGVVSICGSGVVGRSSSSVRRRPHAAKIAGSSPARPIFLGVFLLYGWVKRFIKSDYLRYAVVLQREGQEVERSLSPTRFDPAQFTAETRETSRCSICGEEYETPLFTVVSSGYLIAEYYACPRCLSKVHRVQRQKRVIPVELDEEESEEEAPLEPEQVEEAQEPEEAEVAEPEPEPEPEPVRFEVEEKAEAVAGCAHSLGYLKRRPKNTPIPEECLICNKMIDCMAY
jgi:hypothetical protein